MRMVNRLPRRFLLGLALLLPLSTYSADEPDYSPAERMLFMRNHLANITPPQTLQYAFHKRGTLEENYDDTVRIVLRAQADGTCCMGRGEFLSDGRRVVLPDIDGASGNPVILYFLENEVRNMQRLTKGQANHFRKRIRMAIYEGAAVRETSFIYQGRSVPGHEISISPYVDDPSRARFARFADKQYKFLLSDAVPGGVLGIRTLLGAEAGTTAPLLIEEMLIEGGEPLAEIRPTPAKAI